MENFVVDLKLSVAQVNMILAHLAKGSFESVSEVIAEIQRQGTPQVDAERQRLAAEEAAKPLEGEIIPPEKSN